MRRGAAATRHQARARRVHVACGDVIRAVCVGERLSRADALVTEAIAARARLDEPTLRRDATSATDLRRQAASCIGEEAARGLKSVVEE